MPISLGVAQGEINISTRGVDGAERVVKGASANMTRDLSGIGKGAATAQRSLSGLGAVVTQLGGALGITFGAAAGLQLVGRLAGDSIQAASDLTESINKVGVAFASSQDEILEWSKNSAKALGQSQQQALEGASSFGLLFRTMGLAPKVSADMSMGLVQLAADMASINNISPEDALTKLRAGLVGEIEPLRSVGVLLNATAVESKAMEMGLASSTRALTEQNKVLARYQLILEQTSLTQGDFARTSGALANQQRTLAANIADSQALLGKLLIPSATVATGAASAWLEGQMQMVDNYADKLTDAIAVWQRLQRMVGMGGLPAPGISGTAPWGTRGAPPTNQGAPMRVPPDAAQTGIIRDHFDAVTELEQSSNRDRLSANRQYSEAVAQSERDYHLSSSREAQDFATSRLRAEADFAESIADLHADAARREADQLEDFNRTSARANADSAERIADARADAGERLVELDDKYNKARERAALDHRDKLMDAAGRLDAQAVYEEQRNFARESKDAAEAHDEQRGELQEQLAERIADEQEALAESNADRREAYERQLEDGRENDALREADMTADFAKRKLLEDEDRALKLARAAADYAASQAEMARQHALDLARISQEAAAERALLKTEADKKLAEAGVVNAAFDKQDKARTDAAIANWDRMGNAALRASQLVGFGERAPIAPYSPGATPIPSWMTGASRDTPSSRTYVVQPGALIVNVPPSDRSIADIAVREIMEFLEGLTEGRPQ